MRNVIIFTSLTLSGLMILDSLNVGHAVMMFLLAGVIPGTNTAISAQTMIEVIALISGFVLARLTNRLFASLTQKTPVRRRA